MFIYNMYINLDRTNVLNMCSILYIVIIVILYNMYRTYVRFWSKNLCSDIIVIIIMNFLVFIMKNNIPIALLVIKYNNYMGKRG